MVQGFDFLVYSQQVQQAIIFLIYNSSADTYYVFTDFETCGFMPLPCYFSDCLKEISMEEWKMKSFFDI